MNKINLKEIFKNKKTSTYALVLIAYIIIEVFIKTGSISNTVKALLIPTCAYIVAALALNLVVGYLGDLSLGQSGFMAIGAFSAIVASCCFSRIIDNEILLLVISIIVGGVFASIFGFIIGIPVLKLQGDYLAIVTLAFCQIISSILTNVYCGVDSKGLHFAFLNNNIELLNDGEMAIKGPLGGVISNRISSFTAGVILILITLFVINNLINSKSGRAILACRDNKIAASSVGISTSKYKLMAFVLSACLAGMAGAFYALGYSSIKATKFDFNLSIMILVYVVLGGLGNLKGTIISTTILIVLPEVLRAFDSYRMIVYALVLIVVMIFRNNSKMNFYLNNLLNKINIFKKKGESNAR